MMTRGAPDSTHSWGIRRAFLTDRPERGSPLAELAALLTRDQPVTGVVVSLNGGLARIATSSGMVQARAEGGITEGARVRVVDGLARAAITPTGTYPV